MIEASAEEAEALGVDEALEVAAAAVEVLEEVAAAEVILIEAIMDQMANLERL